MKKLFLPTALFFLSTGIALKAQEPATAVVVQPSSNVMELGFRFMPTFSSFNIKTSSGSTVQGVATLGYGAGALLGVNFTRHIGIEGEVVYNSLSQKYKDQNLNHEIKVNYINVPLLLSLNTGKGNPVNLNFVVGPQLGFNIGSKVIGGNGGSSDTVTSVLVIKKGDLGFAYGAGLQFSLNTARSIFLDLGFRGVYGFMNISNIDQTSSNGTYYIINRAMVRTKSGYIGITFSF